MNRNELLVASRSIPEGAEEIKGANCVAYKWPGLQPCAKGFIGNAGKPAFYHSFRSAEARDRFVAKWLEDRAASEKYRAERLAEKKARLAEPHKLKVGDVLRSSWGYDQTNIDYYEVVALVGSRMVEIRKIGAESKDTGYLCGQCVPVPGKFIGEPMRVRVGEDGSSVKVREWGCYASKMEPMKVDGVAVGYRSSYWSAYA